MSNIGKDNSDLSLYFTNDIHSHIPSSISLLNNLATLKAGYGVMFVDLGDFTEGSAFYNLFHGEPELKIINKLYDFVIPGNHGFQDVVGLYKSGFPVLNCNLLYNGKPFFKEYLIHTINNKDYVFIGIMSPEAFHSIEPKERKGFLAIDPHKILPNLIAKFKKEKVRIILLSHSGFEYDVKIAESFSGIDVILASHCHSSHTKQVVNNTLIAKARENGKGYGKIEMINNQFGATIISINSKDTSLGPELNFLNEYFSRYQRTFYKKLFVLPFSFTRKIRNRKQLTDYLIKHIQTKLSVDLSLVNYHCFRTLLPKGKVTLEDIYNCCPLENDLIVICIGKSQLNAKLKQLPGSLKKYICLSSKTENLPKIINFVTTSYLADVVFADYQKSSYNTGLRMRDIVIEILSKEFGNKNDTYWIKNRRRSEKQKDHN